MPETLILSAPGNYTFIDDGIDGNGQSLFVVDGLVFSFAHPADALIIAAGDGVNITFNITESFGNATVQIGSFFDSAFRPDSIAVNSLVTDSNALLFSDGAISEAGSDAGIDIRAGGLLMSAGGAIGASLNPLEIATGSMEAETRNGGIFLSHFGDLVIGGLSPDVAGLRVHSSGSISVTTVGTDPPSRLRRRCDRPQRQRRRERHPGRERRRGKDKLQCRQRRRCLAQGQHRVARDGRYRPRRWRHGGERRARTRQHQHRRRSPIRRRWDDPHLFRCLFGHQRR